MTHQQGRLLFCTLFFCAPDSIPTKRLKVLTFSSSALPPLPSPSFSLFLKTSSCLPPLNSQAHTEIFLSSPRLRHKTFKSFRSPSPKYPSNIPLLMSSSNKRIMYPLIPTSAWQSTPFSTLPTTYYSPPPRHNSPITFTRCYCINIHISDHVVSARCRCKACQQATNQSRQGKQRMVKQCSGYGYHRLMIQQHQMYEYYSVRAPGGF